ncbi:MAG: class II fructose-bisphosphate aldolase, partial [Firmicutes bacterium]|nr:class II fructose-bisphosphate aldolase [Bacillota bacterium]
MLYNMKTILDRAREERYCVAAPNVFDERSIDAVIRAAERTNSPLIIDISRSTIDRRAFLHLAKASAEAACGAKVPVCVNLDHGKSYRDCVEAAASDCTSIMADRSTLPFEENVQQVAELAKIVHALGKSIEAELGHVGTNVGAEKEIESSIIMRTEQEVRAGFTQVDEAVRYVELTQVDVLAVAVGTVHGAYPKGMVPKIDFERICTLREAVPVPLVVHGGSGTAPEDMARLGPCGITKINLMADVVASGIDYTKRFVEENGGYENLMHIS